MIKESDVEKEICDDGKHLWKRHDDGDYICTVCDTVATDEMMQKTIRYWLLKARDGCEKK